MTTAPRFVLMHNYRRIIAAMTACIFLGGCVGLRGPEGTEAALIEKAASMPMLTSVQGTDVKSAARNGLLISPSVRQAASRISASADEVRVQRAALFPGLNLSANGGVSSAHSKNPSVSLTGSQLLYDGGIAKQAVQLADFDLQVNYIAFQKSVDEALEELLKAYDTVQMQRELLNIYKKQLGALTELDKLVAERSTSGAVSSTDHLDTRRRVQSAAFLVHDTELALGEAQDRLFLLSGETKGGWSNINSKICQAANETDDLRIAELSLARAQVALAKAEKERTPRVLLKPVLGGELGLGKFPVGLNVDVHSDVLQGGALTAKANLARNNVAGAKAKLEATRLEDSLHERGLVRIIAAGERKTNMLKREIKLLKTTRQLYRSQYFDMGTRQLTELLDNEEEYYARQAELVQLRSTLSSARMSCAVRNRTLRQGLGLEDNSIYGFPLSSNAI